VTTPQPIKPNKIAELEKGTHVHTAAAIGGFMVNFGAIEFTSHRWIEKLAGRDSASKLADRPLAIRIKKINALVEQSTWTQDQKCKACQLWAGVSAELPIRNTVCHNPFVTNAGGGFIDVRELFATDGHSPLIDSTAIALAARRVGGLLRDLQAFLGH
jgi:hypothetical protein